MRMSFSRKNNRLVVIVTDKKNFYLSSPERRKMINKKISEYGIMNYIINS